MIVIIALCVGFALDLLIGDPHNWPHSVRAFGWLIAKLEKILRRILPATGAGERAAGTILVLIVCFVGFGMPLLILWLVTRLHPFIALLVQCLMCWQVLAVKSLGKAGISVYEKLKNRDLPQARQAVAMVVGRDTDHLDAAGIAKAAVETVSENTGDGIVAPMFYFALGAGPLAMLYKAVNTMDSMLGYESERYVHFGRSAALLDDAANWVPARLSGLLITAAAFLLRLDPVSSWRILQRDHGKHKSPNAAWPESACAGALGVQLGGVSLYKGVIVSKPTIGDPQREIAAVDILNTVRLEYTAAVLCLFLCLCLRIGILLLVRKV